MLESALSVDLADEAATDCLGASLARSLQSAEDPSWQVKAARVVHLRGELGAGKTTLVRGFLHALGWPGAVRSPSYTLLEPYVIGALTSVHIDLYRLDVPTDLDDLGLRDYLRESHLLLIEWPENGADLTPPADLDIRIEFAGDARRAQLAAKTAYANGWLQRLRGDIDSK